MGAMTYIVKYNLVWHLWVWHDVIMEPSKPRRASTWKEGPTHQGRMAMNVWVLNNLLAQFHHNEQKAIARAKRHINIEWDRL